MKYLNTKKYFNSVSVKNRKELKKKRWEFKYYDVKYFNKCKNNISII